MSRQLFAFKSRYAKYAEPPFRADRINKKRQQRLSLSVTLCICRYCAENDATFIFRWSNISFHNDQQYVSQAFLTECKSAPKKAGFQESGNRQSVFLMGFTSMDQNSENPTGFLLGFRCR